MARSQAHFATKLVILLGCPFPGPLRCRRTFRCDLVSLPRPACRCHFCHSFQPIPGCHGALNPGPPVRCLWTGGAGCMAVGIRTWSLCRFQGVVDLNDSPNKMSLRSETAHHPHAGPPTHENTPVRLGRRPHRGPHRPQRCRCTLDTPVWCSGERIGHGGRQRMRLQVLGAVLHLLFSRFALPLRIFVQRNGSNSAGHFSAVACHVDARLGAVPVQFFVFNDWPARFCSV